MDILVRSTDLRDPVRRGSERNNKLPVVYGGFEEILSDVCKGISITIYINNLPFDLIITDHRLERHFYQDLILFESELLHRFPGCDMTGSLDKNIPGGKGEIVGILEDIEFDDFIRGFIKNQ